MKKAVVVTRDSSMGGKSLRGVILKRQKVNRSVLVHLNLLYRQRPRQHFRRRLVRRWMPLVDLLRMHLVMLHRARRVLRHQARRVRNRPIRRRVHPVKLLRTSQVLPHLMRHQVPLVNLRPEVSFLHQLQVIVQQKARYRAHHHQHLPARPRALSPVQNQVAHQVIVPALLRV